MMGVGKLDKRIRLLERTSVDTGMSTKEVYAFQRSIWANVHFVTDRERFAASAVQQSISVRLTIRTTEIDNTFRFEFDGVTYAIESIRPINKQFMEVLVGGLND